MATYSLIILCTGFFLLNSFSLSYSVALPYSMVTFEVDRVYIVEDRDYGDGEIYVKVTIGSGQPLFSTIFTGISDGATLQLDWVVFDGESDSLTVRIEVWESDADYEEASNDYMGQTTIIWDCQTALSGWYDCEGASGGTNQVQAQVFVVAETEEVSTTTSEPIITGSSSSSAITPPSSIDTATLIMTGLILLVLGSGVLITATLAVFAFSQRRKKQPPQPTEYPTTSEFKTKEKKKPLTYVIADQPFFCQLCSEKHPAGFPRKTCDACARMICLDAYQDMLEAGRTSCPMCGGTLR